MDCCVCGFVHLDGALGDLSLNTLLLLVGATAIAAICAAFDQAAIGMGASSVQLRRNLLASCLRIGFLCGAIALDFRSGEVILVSWTVGLVGSLLASPHSTPCVTPIWGDHKERWQLGAQLLDYAPWATTVSHWQWHRAV